MPPFWYFLLFLYWSVHPEVMQVENSQPGISELQGKAQNASYQVRLFTWICFLPKQEKEKRCFGTFWYTYTTSCLPAEYMQGVDYVAVSILMLNRVGPPGHASIWPGLLCRGVSVCSCRLKFLPNASGGRNGEGFRGFGGGEGGGGATATAVPAAAAAVQKPHEH